MMIIITSARFLSSFLLRLPYHAKSAFISFHDRSRDQLQQADRGETCLMSSSSLASTTTTTTTTTPSEPSSHPPPPSSPPGQEEEQTTTTLLPPAKRGRYAETATTTTATTSTTTPATTMGEIKLTELEEKLFAILLEAAHRAGKGTVLRAAGGWVRDKLLGR